MNSWFSYAVGAAVLYGLHQIFTKMAADKISAFYDDPVKVASDVEGMRVSVYAKQITTETGLEWRVRRLRNNTARQLMIIGRKMRHLGPRREPGMA